MLIGPPRWAERYIGIPFIERGSDLSGCDCLGLMRLVYRDRLSVELGSFNGIDVKDGQSVRDAINAALATPAWAPVTGLMQDYDGVLMLGTATVSGRTALLPKHIGIAAGSRHVLHVDSEGEPSRCEPVSRLKNRIVGVYRYQRVSA
jgi:cell wall-associated NlpC family hydrolase